jgi:hypothetical protein
MKVDLLSVGFVPGPCGARDVDPRAAGANWCMKEGRPA